MAGKKNPWIAAILNFLLFGLGYLYVGVRTNFALLLVISYVIALLDSFIFSVPISYSSFFWLSYVLISLGFAIDAYNEAKKTK